MTEIKQQKSLPGSQQGWSGLIWPVLLFLLLSVSTSWALDFESFDAGFRSTTQYRYTWADDPASGTAADDDNDQDFSQHLGVDISSPESGLKLSAMGRYLKDLDGTPAGSILRDYTDTFSHRQDFSTYYLYLEKQDLLTRGLDLRAGRQYAYGAETVHFDGLLFSLERPEYSGLQLELFGGRLVQHYTDLTRDEVGGYNLAFHPTPHLALTLDGVFSDNNSTEGGFFWQPLPLVQTNGRLAFIDSDPRFFDLTSQILLPRTRTIVNLGVYHRYKVDLRSDYLFDYTYTLENALSTHLTSLYLLQEKAYTDFDIRISQPIPQSQGMTLFARYTKRLMSSSNEDLYNTDFDRFSAGLTLEDWMCLQGFSLTAGYSYWKEDRSLFYEGRSSSFYADGRQRFNKFELGLGFYHKTDDVNSRIEDEASTRYQALLKYHHSKNGWVEVLYQYDQDDFFEDEFGVDSISAMTLTLHQTF